MSKRYASRAFPYHVGCVCVLRCLPRGAGLPERPEGRRTSLLPAGHRRTTHRRDEKMSDTKQPAEDLAILEQLNLEYNEADQASDAKRFSEFLAEDFLVQSPGVTR